MGVLSDFVKNLREAIANAEANGGTANKGYTEKVDEGGHQKAWSFDDDKINYSDAGSAKAGGSPDNLQWMSYTVNDNDNNKAMRIDVGYDQSGKIGGVRNFTGENSANGYYGVKAISDFFKNNFDMDATRYTVSSAPVDIYLPSKIPQEYHDKATVFFDSDDDGAFIPSAVFSPNNLGARRIGDRKSTMYKTKPDSEVQDFIKIYRQNKMRDNTIDRSMNAQEVPPSIFHWG